VKKGKEKGATVSSFPFLSSPPRPHAGVNLLICLSFAAFVLSTPARHWIAAATLWVGTLLYNTIGCRSPRKNLIRMTGVLPFLCLAFLFHAFFTPGTILRHIGPFYVTREGLAEGAWITQKLAFFFFLSFLTTSSVSALFLFQLMERAGRYLPLKRLDPRLSILALFLVLRWLSTLPLSWKDQIARATAGETGSMKRTAKGLRCLTGIFRNEIDRLETWILVFVTRGYAEGVLLLAEAPLPPLQSRHLFSLAVLGLAWMAWIVFIL